MNKTNCLCLNCSNYYFYEEKISIQRRHSITILLREHRQEKKNILIYARNISLFICKIKSPTKNHDLATDKVSMNLLVLRHFFCKRKVQMVLNTLKLLTATERKVITALYLDNLPIQEVAQNAGYEIAQIYRFSGLAISKIALALPMW